MTGNRRIKKTSRRSKPPLRLVAKVTAAPTVTPSQAGRLRGRKKKRRLIAGAGWQLLYLALGVLLGRSVILHTFMPFTLPAYAVTLQFRKGKSLTLALGMTIGAATMMRAGGDPWMTLAMLVSFWLICGGLKRMDALDVYSLPFLAMAIDMGFRFGFSIPAHGVSEYALGVAVVEGLLALILTYMFLQVPPLFATNPPRSWRIEETIAVMILFASMLGGMQGWVFDGVNLESVVARYFILLIAAAGGAGVGGAIGIVTGVVLALGAPAYASFIGVFGFSGVLSGLLHETKKPLVALGYIVGSALLTLYTTDERMLIGEMMAMLIAVIGYLLTPNRWIAIGAGVLPGTVRHAYRQQEHVRRIKSILTQRIQDIASIFSQLSGSFTEGEEPSRRQEVMSAQVLERTVHQICTQCDNRKRCWGKYPDLTMQRLGESIRLLEISPDLGIGDLTLELAGHCVKTERLLETLKEAHELVLRHQQTIQQLRDSRQIVAEQLSGVAGIMLNLAEEIQLETGVNHRQEEAILRAFVRLGLEVEDVEIISLEEGNVDIEVLQLHPSVHDEAGKLVAPLLSEILDENITVRSVEQLADGTAQRIRLSSACQFQVQSGFASVAKNGTLQSGDFYSVMDLGNGKCAVALSDGMGNGKRANQESSAAVNLVQQLLRAGFPEEVAIKTVNSALVLRSTDEMFATLDLAIIDLFTAKAEFLKVGSVPSFVRQTSSVLMVKGESLPIGILDEIEIQTKSVALHEGNMLVFMSDGIFEALSSLPEPEEWVSQQLEQVAIDDPQRLADWLLEVAIRVDSGQIRDDMTIVCAKIERNKPNWATIHLPDLPTIRTRKDRKRIEKSVQERVERGALEWQPDVYMRLVRGE